VTFTEVMDKVAEGFEAFGAAVLVLGLVWSLAFAAVVWRRSGNGRGGYQALGRPSAVRSCWVWKSWWPPT